MGSLQVLQLPPTHLRLIGNCPYEWLWLWVRVVVCLYLWPCSRLETWSGSLFLPPEVSLAYLGSDPQQGVFAKTDKLHVFLSAGTGRNSLNQPNIWLTILLTSILCILPVVTFRFLLIQLCPTINDKVQVQPCTFSSPVHLKVQTGASVDFNGVDKCTSLRNSTSVTKKIIIHPYLSTIPAPAVDSGHKCQLMYL